MIGVGVPPPPFIEINGLMGSRRRRWGVTIRSAFAVSEQTIRKMLSREQVLVPFSLATLKREIKAGRFPQSHEIAVRRVAWFEDEVVAWQSERTQAA